MLVAQVAQLQRTHGAQTRLEEVVGNLNRCADETAAIATPAGRDHATLAQDGQGVAQGHGGHAKAHCQLTLAGQLLALGDQAKFDHLDQSASHFLGLALLADFQQGQAVRVVQLSHVLANKL
ncbi:hypothetical protein D3C87_1574250 [compost metagenome]